MSGYSHQQQQQQHNNAPPSVAVGELIGPSVSSPPSHSTPAVSELAEYLLENQGYPLGLAKELCHSKSLYPLRFWVVDNSGSMATADGRELSGSNTASLAVTKCTRWQELQSTVEYHIGLANLLGIHTIFRLLNPPTTTGQQQHGSSVLPQEFSIAEHGTPSDATTVTNAMHVMRSIVPAGVTPLTAHLRLITERVSQVAPMLRQESQRAVVVIATDGLPTNARGDPSDDVKREFTQALQTLQKQPVWIVIRLCTQNPAVVAFYNDLDKELEAQLEVLDDFLGEAYEVTKRNKWLNYTLPLHRCREMGYHHRVFDLLDEGSFNHDQLRSFVQLLFGRDFADPLVDWKEFIQQVNDTNESVGKEWNVNSEKLAYWFDKKELTKQFAPTKRGFFGF